MVLLPGCPCCDTCTGLFGPLCAYRVSVDNGVTWSPAATSPNFTYTTELEPIVVQGVSATPALTIKYSSQNEQGSLPVYGLEVDIFWSGFDGLKQHTGYVYLDIFQYANRAAPSTFNREAVVAFGWAMSLSGTTPYFSNDQLRINSSFLEDENDTDNRILYYLKLPCETFADRECAGLSGRRHYLPRDITIVDSSEIAGQEIKRSNTFITAPIIQASKTFPNFLGTTLQDTPLDRSGVEDNAWVLVNGGVLPGAVVVELFGQAWDFMSSLVFKVSANPLP